MECGLVVFVGTRAGLFEWQSGRVTPLATGAAASSTGESITALASLPGERIAVGTASGSLLVVDRRGRAGRAATTVPSSSVPPRDPTRAAAITSLVRIPASNPRATDSRLLAATANGRLLEARLLTLRGELALEVVERDLEPAGAIASLQIVGVPDRPRSALVVSAGRGVTFLSDPNAAPHPWSDEPLLELAAHPTESSLWLARTQRSIVRSNDGARTFRPIGGWPTDLRPRLVHFAAGPSALALAVSFPTLDPPDPADPSPLWTSRDAGLSFHPVASRTIDRARDPSGEITALTTTLDVADRGHDAPLVLFATDRGELLQWRGADAPAELLADHLPPITTLLPVRSSGELDPSTSGIHLLP